MERETIKKIIIDQKTELESITKRISLIERSFAKKYSQYMNSSQIKVIIGIRRCGKSVLSYQLLNNKDFAYINFDDEKLAGINAEHLNDILEVFHEIYGDLKYILLDEVQNITGWELFVNRLQRQGFNLIVTGSNSHLLSKELSTHLTGRHIELELFPFSFREFLFYNKVNIDLNLLSTKDTGLIKSQLDLYLRLGGFPEVVRDPENKKIYHNSLYSDIINKDIIIRHNVKLGSVLKEIANNFISNVSSQVSANKIKNTFNLNSTTTVSDYIYYLEESFLFLFLPRFSYKAKEVSIASKKVYSIDTGMVDSIGLNFSQNFGRIYENIVFLELVRRKSQKPKEIFYWQDSKNIEVDFLLKEEGKVSQLIQVCYNIEDINTKDREIKPLIKASNELKCNNLLIITRDAEKEEEDGGKTIKYIPLWKWLLI